LPVGYCLERLHAYNASFDAATIVTAALVSDSVVPQTVSEEQCGDGERSGVSTGIDTNKHSGGGAPQVGDLRLLEDGGERSGALGSDFVVPETADEGRSGDGERVASMSMGAGRKTNTQGPVRGSCGLLELLQRGVALETLGESGGSIRAEAVVAQTASTWEQRWVLRRVKGH